MFCSVSTLTACEPLHPKVPVEGGTHGIFKSCFLRQFGPSKIITCFPPNVTRWVTTTGVMATRVEDTPRLCVADLTELDNVLRHLVEAATLLKKQAAAAAAHAKGHAPWNVLRTCTQLLAQTASTAERAREMLGEEYIAVVDELRFTRGELAMEQRNSTALRAQLAEAQRTHQTDADVQAALEGEVAQLKAENEWLRQRSAAAMELRAGRIGAASPSTAARQAFLQQQCPLSTYLAIDGTDRASGSQDLRTWTSMAPMAHGRGQDFEALGHGSPGVRLELLAKRVDYMSKAMSKGDQSCAYSASLPSSSQLLRRSQPRDGLSEEGANQREETLASAKDGGAVDRIEYASAPTLELSSSGGLRAQLAHLKREMGRAQAAKNLFGSPNAPRIWMGGK